MKFTTKTEYGLICLIYLARHANERLVTVKDIVKNERFSLTYIEKILQRLKAAKIVKSHQGKEGGYSLAREAAEITLRDIIEALEGQTFNIYCRRPNRKSFVCTHFSMCDLKNIWMRTKKLLDDYYSSITLDSIARQEKWATSHG